jgi:hypothetical protein
MSVSVKTCNRSNPFSVNAGGMFPTCLPGARERAGMEGANASEHGRAARPSGTDQNSWTVIAIAPSCGTAALPCAGGVCGEQGERPPWRPPRLARLGRSRSGKSERSSPYVNWRVHDLRSRKDAAGWRMKNAKYFYAQGDSLAAKFKYPYAGALCFRRTICDRMRD